MGGFRTGYDELSRLTGVTSGSGNWTYAYDATGNRSQHVQGGATTSYVTGQSQESSATRDVKARISFSIASAGVAHPSVMRGRRFISLAT